MLMCSLGRQVVRDGTRARSLPYYVYVNIREHWRAPKICEHR
jgi:hypothetical protein